MVKVGIIPAGVHAVQPGGGVVGLAHPDVGVAALASLAGDCAEGFVAVAGNSRALLVGATNYASPKLLLFG